VVISRGIRREVADCVKRRDRKILGQTICWARGQLLDKILQALNLTLKRMCTSPTRFFVCRPRRWQAFRKPTDEEIKYYRPYVVEIIRFIDSVIICYGMLPVSHSWQTDYQPARTVFQVRRRSVMPIFHPIFALESRELSSATKYEDEKIGITERLRTWNHCPRRLVIPVLPRMD